MVQHGGSQTCKISRTRETLLSIKEQQVNRSVILNLYPSLCVSPQIGNVLLAAALRYVGAPVADWRTIF
jgi:hypothetical protein